MPNDNKPCIAFSLKDAKEAMQHMKEREVIERYGGQCNGHLLHTWDDGESILFKCKNCGGYILVQLSEFHGMEDAEYYADYFPVSSPNEAMELNQKYDGFEIENNFPSRYLMVEGFGLPHWS